MNWKSILALAALVWAAHGVVQSQTSSSGQAPSESAAAPSDQDVPWIHPDTRWVYHYSPSLDHWVGPAMAFGFGRQAANAAADIKYFSISGDTTTAIESGIEWPYDMLITRVSLGSDEGSGAVDATVQFQSASDTTYFTIGYGGANQKDTTMSYELKANSKMELMITTGTIQPDDPHAIIWASPIIDP